MNSIHNSKQKDAEESNHALNHENTVERDNEGQWTKIQSQKKPNEVKTLIIGDSMIKDIDPKLMSADGSIIKKSRPGGKLEDMSAMFNNCELKCKKSVIIHMGTNNITSNDSPTDMASKLATETEKIQSLTQAPRVIVSGIIHRKDVKENLKITEANKQLKKICDEKKWKFIDNERIDDSCLNSSKLHLNKKGSAYLASNFLKKINPNTRRSSDRSSSKAKSGNFQQQNSLLTALVQNFLQNQDHR